MPFGSTIRVGTRLIDLAPHALPPTLDDVTVFKVGPQPVPIRTVDVLITQGPHPVRGPALVIQRGGVPGQTLAGAVVEPSRTPGPSYYAPTLVAELMNIINPELLFEVAGEHLTLPMSVRLQHDIALMATSKESQVAVLAARRDEGGWLYWFTDGIPDSQFYSWIRRLLPHHEQLLRDRFPHVTSGDEGTEQD